MRTLIDIYPGDSIDIHFPEGFTLDYEKTMMDDNGEFVKRIFTSPCTRMNAYYWDEDDHRCLDFYFYNDNDDNSNWFAKQYYLTPESRKKVEDFLRKWSLERI